jgi:hypothetical protein
MKNDFQGPSCLWIADDIGALINSGLFGGRSALVMTKRAVSQIPAILAGNFLPSITVPDPLRALEWAAAL